MRPSGRVEDRVRARELNSSGVNRRHGDAFTRVLTLVDKRVALGLIGVECPESVA